ncbi:hypothetical protein ACKKBF_B33975 [Auxenochlorella protothecoides x Auxenochlorella symbiontica]
MSFSHAVSSDWYPHGLRPMVGGDPMQATLRRMSSGVELQPMQSSAFVRPYSIMYQLDGRKRRWDAVESHPSVACVLLHKGLDSLIMVRQFRPAVYAAAVRAAEAAGEPTPPMSVGFTYELCAGIVDKPGLPLTKIMQEEINEECGFHVEEADLEKITSVITALGISGPRMTLFLAEVDDSQALPTRGGLGSAGEAIEVLALPLASIPAFLADEGLAKSASVMFAVMWLQQRLAARQARRVGQPARADVDVGRDQAAQATG